MLPDRISNPGLLTYESGALPIALRGPAFLSLRERICYPKEFAALRILNLLLKEFAPFRIFCRFVFTYTSCLLNLELIEGN